MIITILLSATGATASPTLSLTGEWRFRLDRDDVGLRERWFAQSLPGRIHLPGALQNQGFGDDIGPDTPWTGDTNAQAWRTLPQYARYRTPGHIKIPWALQPKKHYVGAAWYQRDIVIPAGWRGLRAELMLERAHWQTRLWLDGREIGADDSLSTPHRYLLPMNAMPGRHTLTIRVDNRILVDVGIWAHSVTDHTQGNWNGIVGRIEMTAEDPVRIDDLQVFPHVASRSITVKGSIHNSTGKAGSGTILFTAVPIGPDATAGRPVPRMVQVTWRPEGGAFAAEYRLGPGARLWDEFQPSLYRLSAWLSGRHDRASVNFGLREVGTRERMLTVNGRKIFLRGTLECCVFPVTGYPSTDRAAWRHILRVCRAHGLNHLRFHSWCPPEAAFDAADEMGFYYQVECAAWTRVGDDAPIDRWLYREAERILRAYGNHPSFLLMPYGNEPSGDHHVRYLAQWVERWKQRDPRRLYTSASGWPSLPENQYDVTPAPRGPGGWGGRDYREAVKGLAVPAIVHEMGQWCAYPNFDEIPKYTGMMRARNFEIFRDLLSEHGMLSQWRDFLAASGRLQTLCYKEEVEAALRTPGIGGVQLLGLNDFPGQGTALVGVVDAFWDSKGYVTPAAFRRFFGPTVPLARLEKRVWTQNEPLVSGVEIAHFGPTPLKSAVLYWRLVAPGGAAVRVGTFPACNVPVGAGPLPYRISLNLSQLPAPARYRLVIGVRGTPYENDWNVWIYPARQRTEEPPDVLVAPAWDDAVAERLRAGGRVLLLTTRLPAEHPRGAFTPVFWNRQMFTSQAAQTLGLLCDPKHPALHGFPTDFHSDWEWADILDRSRAVVLDGMPAGLRPIVQVIDDWNTNRRLALAFECRIGPGRLLVCAADLTRDLPNRPAARQLRASLLAYAGSAAFVPSIQIAPDAAERLLRSESVLFRMGARVMAADSEDEAHGNVAANVLDGDPGTFWNTRWTPDSPPMPHSLTIDLGRELVLPGITCLPRQDMSNGRIAEFEIYAGDDPRTPGPPVARGRWPDTDRRQEIRFPQPIRARYLRLVALSEVNGGPWAALAELDVLP